MIDCVTQYKKALRKNLPCSGKVKRRLLSKFNASLSSFLEEAPTPGMDELYTAFGAPGEMASILMEEVTAEEMACYRKNSMATQIIACSLIGITLFLLVATSTCIYFYKEEEAVYNGNILVVSEAPTPSE